MTVRLNQPPRTLSNSVEDMAWLEQLARIVNTVALSGTTAERPTTTTLTQRGSGATLFAGLSYWDTTLNKPIWIKSITGSTVDWVDATGAAV